MLNCIHIGVFPKTNARFPWFVMDKQNMGLVPVVSEININYTPAAIKSEN